MSENFPPSSSVAEDSSCPKNRRIPGIVRVSGGENENEGENKGGR